MQSEPSSISPPSTIAPSQAQAPTSARFERPSDVIEAAQRGRGIRPMPSDTSRLIRDIMANPPHVVLELLSRLPFEIRMDQHRIFAEAPTEFKQKALEFQLIAEAYYTQVQQSHFEHLRQTPDRRSSRGGGSGRGRGGNGRGGRPVSIKTRTRPSGDDLPVVVMGSTSLESDPSANAEAK